MHGELRRRRGAYRAILTDLILATREVEANGGWLLLFLLLLAVLMSCVLDVMCVTETHGL